MKDGIKMNMEKPILNFLEENISPDFSARITDEILKIENIEKDNLLYIISLSYKEGISDGFKIAAWLYE